MLFDLQDYVSAGIIGTNQQPMDSSKWNDMYQTYRYARDAFFKNFREWIDSEVLLSQLGNSECLDKINDLVEEFNLNADNHEELAVIFWAGLINGEYSKSAHKDYSDSLDKLMYSIRKLLSIFNNDKSKY